MRIYVMRHGTTVWNEKQITQGRSQNRLSKNGKVLAEEASKKIEGVNFDVIFCSPLMRTMQTANIINKKHKVKIIKDERLTEIDQGVFTGRGKNQISESDAILKNSRSEKCKMESYSSVLLRVQNFLQFLKTTKYNTVFIVTHNVTASLISCVCEKIPVDFNNNKHLRNFDNAEIKMFEI